MAFYSPLCLYEMFFTGLSELHCLVSVLLTFVVSQILHLYTCVTCVLDTLYWSDVSLAYLTSRKQMALGSHMLKKRSEKLRMYVQTKTWFKLI